MDELSALKSEVMQFISIDNNDYEFVSGLCSIWEEFKAKKQRKVVQTNCDVISNEDVYDEITILGHLRVLQKQNLTMSDLADTGVALYVDRLTDHTHKEIRETAENLSRKWKSMVSDWTERTFLKSSLDTTSKRPLDESSVLRLPSMKKIKHTSIAEPISEEDSPRSIEEESGVKQ